ncbi:hypothetical protein KR032_009927, partial [Drosophila birchii]
EQKFENRLESLTGIPGEEETLAVFKMRPAGREHFFNGTLSVLTDLDEGAINTYSLKNGEWTQSYFNARSTPCDLYTNYLYKYYFPTNADTNLQPGGDNCFGKGEYYFRNITLATENWPTLPYRGIIKVIVKYFRKGKSVGGLEVVCTIRDKPT